MSTDSKFATYPARLNPFLFPSDTDFRFVLLIVSLLGTSLFAYNWLYNTLFDTEYRQSVARCFEVSAVTYPLEGINPTTNPEAYADQVAARVRVREACLEPFEQAQARGILVGVACVLIVAGVIYWLSAALKIQRSKSVPLTAEDGPDMVAYLDTLCREAKLQRPPTFLVSPLNPAISGVAFGRVGHYYVALNGGLVTQFYTNQPIFRAVVLHELAHIKNADIDKTYFALAIWYAFVAVALVPLISALISEVLRFPGELGFTLGLIGRILALTAFVYLTLSAVLRTREVYADVRASVWDGPTGALRDTLAALPHPKGGSWRAVWSGHPHPEERRRLLDTPHRLFRLSTWDAFGTGIAATLAFPELVAVLSMLLGSQYEYYAWLGAGLLFAPLVVGVVGLGVWRNVFAKQVCGNVALNAGRLGLSVGLGFIVGQSLSLYASIPSLPSSVNLIDGIVSFAFLLLWCVLLLTSLYFFVRWIAAGASVWVETATTRYALPQLYRLGLIVAGGVLAIWLDALFRLLTLGYQGVLVLFGRAGPLAVFDTIINSPLTNAMLISLWVFPLAAWFWRKQVAATSAVNWAYLEPPPQSVIWNPQPPLRPSLALRLGLVSGLLFVGLMAVARIGLHLSVLENVRYTAGWVERFRTNQFALAILMQVGVAAVASIWVKRVGWAHGMLAAFMAGCVMTFGIIALVELGDCVDVFSLGIRETCVEVGDLTYFQLVFNCVVNWGTLLSLPIAAGSSAVARWIRYDRLR